ncbi:hypothetical protein NM688_g9017 [Phlebia brevispora]|uniref:Uncharacterized protein n=1 Tax=Phlebia brevispora TaxID=194682 RepID=A0ACC1RN19_9APHY|nr:hypothetical protein NM688_g9017 [Phlebia brevispora]
MEIPANVLTCRAMQLPTVPQWTCDYDCNSTGAQNWVINSGSTAVQLAGTNYCLDAGDSPANGVQMKIWECYSSLAAQTWYYTDDNRIALENQGLCLDLTNGSTDDGTIMQIWACTDDNSNQVWTDQSPLPHPQHLQSGSLDTVIDSLPDVVNLRLIRCGSGGGSERDSANQDLHAATANAGEVPAAIRAEDNAHLPRLTNRPGTPNILDGAGGNPLLIGSNKALDDSLRRLADHLIQGIRDIKAERVNGWAEIASALNNVDNDKIGHCKEDIDTLLVFASLFSAVLTAFVVESYQALSPDPSDQVVQLLTQIAVQTNSYTITSSYINAIATAPSSPPPFRPQPIYIHVNRLWFISLILSLITASFGILIKQ